MKITIKQNTPLKLRLDQASNLGDSEKLELPAGTELEVAGSVKGKHIVFVGYIFAEHCKTDEPQFLSLEDLHSITIGATKEELHKFIKPLNEGFEKYQVNTPLRIAHFLAQVLHESGEFYYQEELASGADYEGRTDLGNTKPGDGVRFKGRGLIQCTGRANYHQLSKDTGIDYVGNPEKLAQIPHCVNSAFWYWDTHSLNYYADKDQFDNITRAINGGYNGYDDRLKYLKRAKDVLLK